MSVRGLRSRAFSSPAGCVAASHVGFCARTAHHSHRAPGPIVGIDLGTSGTPRVSVMRDAIPIRVGRSGIWAVHPRQPDSVVTRVAGLESALAAADAFLGQSATEAVVAVPAHFGDVERLATKAAVEKASGLKVTRLVNEPTLAALGYDHVGFRNGEANVAVVDLGGSGFAVSILKLEYGVFEIIATRRGAYDFDTVIANVILQSARQVNPMDDQQRLHLAEGDLMAAAVKAKCDLTCATTAIVELPLGREHGGSGVRFHLTRDHVDAACADTLRDILLTCEGCVADAGLPVDTLVLAGGMARMPALRRAIERFFGRPAVANPNVNPEDAVVLGAAVQGNVLCRYVAGMASIDALPMTIGVRVTGRGALLSTPLLVSRGKFLPVEATASLSVPPSEGSAAESADLVCISVVVLNSADDSSSESDRVLARFDLDSSLGTEPTSDAPRTAAPNGGEFAVSLYVDGEGICRVEAVETCSGRTQGIAINVSDFAPSPS